MPRTMVFDVTLWDQDWFINLPRDYKDYYIYVRTHSEQTGISLPRKTMFERNVLENKKIFLDDFVAAVNENDDGSKSNRIELLPNKRFFFPDYLQSQLGKKLRPTFPVHHGAFASLIENGVHINKTLDFDWLGLELLDFQCLKLIANDKALRYQSFDKVLEIYSQLKGDELLIRNKEIKQNINTSIQYKEIIQKGGMGEKENGDVFENENFSPENFSEEISELNDTSFPYEEKFDSRPLEANVIYPVYMGQDDFELKEMDIGATIQFVQITTKCLLTHNEVVELWTAHRIQYFTGKKPYNGRHDILQHFRDSVKLLKINQNGKSSTGNSGKEQPSRISALKSW